MAWPGLSVITWSVVAWSVHRVAVYISVPLILLWHACHNNETGHVMPCYAKQARPWYTGHAMTDRPAMHNVHKLFINTSNTKQACANQIL